MVLKEEWKYEGRGFGKVVLGGKVVLRERPWKGGLERRVEI